MKYTQITYATCAVFYGRLKKTKIAIHSGLGVRESHVNARKNVTTDVTGGCTIGALIFTTKIVKKAKQIWKSGQKNIFSAQSTCLHQLKWHGMKKRKKMWFYNQKVPKSF